MTVTENNIQVSNLETNTYNLINQEVLKLINITSLEQMILTSLEKFFENKKNAELFLSFVSDENNISIRLIDHYVTKYSKNHKISYKLVENGVETSFNVFNSYRQQLKAFQKKHFDPFSRGDRIPYFILNNCVITTIGQLNFFKWFITKKVYDYINEKHDEIDSDMNKRNKNSKSDKGKSNTKKYKKTYCYNQKTNYNTSNSFSCGNSTYSMDAPKKDIVVKFWFS